MKTTIFDLSKCNICGRKCQVNRINNYKSFCSVDQKIYIASIFNHKGEEPPISGAKGICNVFFAHCNMQCVYCQNYQISDNRTEASNFKISLEEAVNQIISILNKGVPAVGFVTPCHQVPQMIEIIEALHAKGYFPIIVYNTNAYENIETLKIIEKYVDVYLPDLKYSDNSLAQKYSKTTNYVETAIEAIKEMIRQKSDYLYINKDGYAESGVIIRHLVLPNHVENSIGVMDIIAKELSPNIHISLMSQYYPTHKAFEYPELSRHITEEEYTAVKKHMEKLGLTNGWIQEYESKDYYRPNFESNVPFID